MKEVDLKSVLSLLVAKIRWIILGTVLAALLFGGYAKLFVAKEYTSVAKVYVLNTRTDYEINGTTASNLTAAQQLVNNYSILMTTKPVLEAAVQQLDGRLTTAQLAAAVSADNMGETSWLKVSVTLEDADLAEDACSAIAAVSAAKFGELDAASAKVVEVSAAAQTAPHVARTAIIGALLGLVVAVAIILLRQLTDNTVHDRHDLKEHLDVPILGEIPSFELAKASKRKGGRTHA